MKILEIDENQAQLLLKILESKNQELAFEIKCLQEKYTSNINLIYQIKKLIHDPDGKETTLSLFDISKDYKKTWTWKEKILHILKIKQGFFSAREILEIIYKHEPEMKLTDRKNTMNLSSVLISLIKGGEIERQKNEISKEYQYKIRD